MNVKNQDARQVLIYKELKLSAYVLSSIQELIDVPRNNYLILFQLVFIGVCLDHGEGAARVSNYVTSLMATAPEMLKNVSGIDLEKMVKQLTKTTDVVE